MGTLQGRRLGGPRPSIGLQPGLHGGLPVGIRQIDCDGPVDRLLDAGGNQLWTACDPGDQERIASRFAELHFDSLRDAVLDVEDGSRRVTAGVNHDSAVLLGRLLWPAWINFRDRALREKHQRGEMPRD